MIRIFIKKFAAVLLSAALLNLQAPAAAVWAAEAATLDGIDVGADEVTLHLSEQVRYNSFVTAEPPRLIIELLNTEFTASGKVKKGSGKFLKRVRSAQYQREPNLISRIVFDLEKLVAYRARWDKNKLIVMLMGGEDDEADAEDEEPPAVADIPEPAPMPAPVVAEAPKPAPKPVPKPVVKKPVPTPQAAPAEVKEAVSAPASVEVKKAVPVAALKVEPAAAPMAESTEMPSKMTTEASAELTRIAVGSDLTPEAPEAPPKKPQAETSRHGAGKSRHDIIGSLSTDAITLDFDNMAIQDILKLLAIKANVNMVYGSDVTGSMTLHLVDVPFNEAFTTILSMQGLVVNQVGQNILRVMTPTTLQKERKSAVQQTRVIPLTYVQAKEVKASVDAVRMAEQRAGIVNIDEYTNSLIVTDSLDGIEAMERLLAKLDTRPKQVMIEVKLVEVSLSKDFDIGVEWDYFSIDRGNAGNKLGDTVVGSIPGFADPTNIVNPRQGMGLNDNPLTFQGAGGAGGSTGGGARGTGVFLPATNAFGAFTYGRVTNNFLLNATLSAAASRGKAKVLSDPKISALNGEKASIDITTSVPFVTTETTLGATATSSQKVSYTITGIKLAVTPTINTDGSITLEVNPEVSQPSAVGAAAGSTGAIATDSRKAQTTVYVQDGETIVIGGLISDSESEQEAKIPLLGDIPFLGWLFKKKSLTRNRTELLIFVTTKIVEA